MVCCDHSSQSTKINVLFRFDNLYITLWPTDLGIHQHDLVISGNFYTIQIVINT